LVSRYRYSEEAFGKIKEIGRVFTDVTIYFVVTAQKPERKKFRNPQCPYNVARQH
jgi:hypothetical protein